MFSFLLEKIRNIFKIIKDKYRELSSDEVKKKDKNIQAPHEEEED